MASALSAVTLAYLAAPVVTLVTAVGLASYIVRRHWDERGARSFLLTLGMGSVWMLALFVHVLPTGPTLQLVSGSAEFVASMFTISAFVVFVSRYTRRGFHRRRLVQASIAGITVGLVALTVTNPWHRLVYRGYTVRTDPITYISFDHGVAWLGTIVVVGLLVGYASLVLVEYLLSSSGRTEMQLVMLLVGGLFIGLMEVLGKNGFLPAEGLHHGGYGLLPWMLLVTVALFRFRLLDIQPVARNAVVERLQDPVLILDDDRRIVDANREARTIWSGLDGRIGAPFAEVCPSLADAVRFPTETPQTTSQTEVSVDGDTRHYSVRVSAVGQGRSDATSRYAVVLRDVTEFELSRWQLRAQNERLDQVASTISHDLRNPLDVALMNLDVVRDDILGDDDVDPEQLDLAREYLEDVSGSLTRIEQIISDVLTIAREGQLVTETEEVELASAVRAAWDNVATGDATLTVHENRVVAADRGRLLTIFENLVRNAVDHGPPDVTVEAGTTETGFYLQDDGPGIPAGRVENVFEYGFTTSQEGTGLGLSIVRTMAESHGWIVTLDTDYEDGTRFEFDTRGNDPGTRGSKLDTNADQL